MGSLGCHRGSFIEIWEVYVDPIGVIRGHLYEVWELFEGHRGVKCNRFGKCMETLGGHILKVWGKYWHPSPSNGSVLSSVPAKVPLKLQDE